MWMLRRKLSWIGKILSSLVAGACFQAFCILRSALSVQRFAFRLKKQKASRNKSRGFLNKYGNYLLSRIVVQYHRP
jgi:hypothetical protein